MMMLQLQENIWLPGSVEQLSENLLFEPIAHLALYFMFVCCHYIITYTEEIDYMMDLLDNRKQNSDFFSCPGSKQPDFPQTTSSCNWTYPVENPVVTS